jgi:hypothetical protein
VKGAHRITPPRLSSCDAASKNVGQLVNRQFANRIVGYDDSDGINGNGKFHR